MGARKLQKSMRVYEVQPGDSPASIAARDDMAGCPKCSVDLVHANLHKPHVTMPNGFKTFKDLHAGEKIILPEKWFSGELDTRPRSYFAALPHADGVTRSTLGDAAAGLLADYSTLDAASAKVDALTTMGDQQFNDAVNDVAATLDASVQDTSGTGAPAIYAAPYAQGVRKSTAQARQRGVELAAAIKSGDQGASFSARNDILHDFSSALGSAQLALQSFYGDEPAAPGFSSAITSAAHTAATAIASDPGYCSSVSHVGSAVNSAVHAFKTAWNASQKPALPISTGNYEQETSEALATVLGGAPLPCGGHVVPAPVSPPQTITPPVTSIKTGSVAGIALLGAAAVGGGFYFATRKKSRQ